MNIVLYVINVLVLITEVKSVQLCCAHRDLILGF